MRNGGSLGQYIEETGFHQSACQNMKLIQTQIYILELKPDLQALWQTFTDSLNFSREGQNTNKAESRRTKRWR